MLKLYVVRPRDRIARLVRLRFMFRHAARAATAVRRCTQSRLASTSSSLSTSDAIVMRDMVFFAKHGALEAERVLGQKFTVNVELFTPLDRAGASDALADTVDYAKAWAIVRDVVERGPTRITIEKVAEEVAGALLSEFGVVRRAVVAVDKKHVAIEGVLGSLGVRIVRERA